MSPLPSARKYCVIPYGMCISIAVRLVANCYTHSVAEWLACWTQAHKAWVQIAVVTLSGNSLRQTVHTHCASVHQAAKLAAALLRVVGVTASLAESNGSLPLGLWLTSPAGWLPRTGISSGTLRSVIYLCLLLNCSKWISCKSMYWN